MSVRPLIGVETTPFFNLAPVSAASSPHTPPPYILYPPDAPIPCPVCKVVDNDETTQCSYCRKEFSIWHLSCIAFVTSIMLSPCLLSASQVSRRILAVFSALLQYRFNSQKCCATVVSYASTHMLQTLEPD